jgi:protein dithiol oxidoreductase (disulfide-forming)
MLRRLLFLAALTALGACSRNPSGPAPQPPAAPTAPAATTQPSPPPPPSSAPSPPAPSAQSEIQQATASQESAGEDARQAKSDTSLEKMTSLPSQAPDGKWKAGINYDVLVPARPTSVAPGKVEVLEIFWLGCPHCYDFEPLLKGWLKSKPNYVEFVRAHVIWQQVHRWHARLYYTIEALGRPGLFEKAFEAIHQLQKRGEPGLVGNSDDESFRVQQSWAVQNGVSAEEFAQAYNSFGVNMQMQRAEELTQRYQVQGVPFIAVNGKYTTDIGKAGGEAKLIELINDLVAAEHRH